MSNQELNTAWDQYKVGKLFKTTLLPLAGHYAFTNYPLMINHYVPVKEEEPVAGQRPKFRVEPLRVDTFSKEFFGHLKRSEVQGYAPPMLLNFNSISCYKVAFKLKKNLGDTRKKFIRFEHNGIEYLSSNLYSSVELLEFVESDGGMKAYSHSSATPIPTFDAFLKVVSFSRRFQ